MEKRRCFGCMGVTENAVCERCGWPHGKNNEVHQLSVGTKLRGQYIVGRVLGQGGFGITYLGWDDYLDMPVAVKEFYPNAMVTRECTVSTAVHCTTEQVLPQYNMSKERFLREAKALARLRDVPEVVGVHGFFEENGTAYIIMEYVKGTDLATYVNLKGGRLSPDETFRILRPVMEALDMVHQAELVHRDISPDNIMLHPRGGAKLLDFGAVRSVEGAEAGKDMARSTEAILKHGFAPAEQYKSRGGLGPWTDEYALCATIYYCLTGRVPPQAVERMLEDIEVDFDIPGLPKHQQEALAQGMAIRAKDRHGSMQTLIEALFPATAPEPLPMPQPAPVVRQMPVSQPAPAVGQTPVPQPAPTPRPAPVPERKVDDSPSAKPVPVKEQGGQTEPSGNIPQKTAEDAKKGGRWIFAPTDGWKNTVGGRVYYKDGKKLTSAWVRETYGTYYVGREGRMATEWQFIDGKMYYFGEDGKMFGLGWKYLKGSWYYFGQDGVMRTGWQKIDGDTYYFTSHGMMYTGIRFIDGRSYDFGENGKLK